MTQGLLTGSPATAPQDGIGRRGLRAVLTGVNRLLGAAGLELIRTHHRNRTDFRDYITFETTMAAARAAGLSVGDYIDARHNFPGATQETIDQLTAIGALHPGLKSICAIGPGSGRYLERTIRVCSPQQVEIYETAPDWREYLVRTYPVVARGADGISLSETPSASVDLVQAHKVFPGLPFLVVIRYLIEMARVVRPGGKVIFDMVTEACMDADTLQAWLESGTGYQSYPTVYPRQFVLDFMGERGLRFEGGFVVPMKPGKTEYVVFGRQPASEG